MRRFNLAGGLALVLACAGVAQAQNENINSMGGSRMGGQSSYAPNQGGYVVGPALGGAGGSYSYVQQNPGRTLGMSPNAYYSMNYFTTTPMATTAPFAYQSNYAAPAYSNPSSMAVVPSQGGPAYVTGTTPYATNPYSSANANYYRVRRGPFQRMIGR